MEGGVSDADEEDEDNTSNLSSEFNFFRRGSEPLLLRPFRFADGKDHANIKEPDRCRVSKAPSSSKTSAGSLPCLLANCSPHALHSVFGPFGPRRHSGVTFVPHDPQLRFPEGCFGEYCGKVVVSLCCLFLQHQWRERLQTL